MIKKNNGLYSRNDLSRISQYSMTAVAIVINELLEEGIVTETESLDKRVGRKPVILSINAEAMYFLGVECNSYHVRLVVTDLMNNYIYEETRYVTSQTTSHVMELMIELIDNLKQSNPRIWAKIKCMSIGVPGTLDREKGIGVLYLSIRDWKNVNIYEILSSRYDKPLYFLNNIDGMMEGYQATHTSENQSSIMFLLIRNGAGMRIYSNGRFLSDYGVICEFGHMPARNSTRLCTCGKRGCYDSEITLPAIKNKIAEAMHANRFTELEAKCRDNGGVPSIEMLMDEIRLGNKSACEILDNVSQYIGEMLAEALLIFSPEKIILSTDFCSLGAVFENQVIETITRNSMTSCPPVHFMESSGHLCAFGAAVHGYNMVFSVRDVL
jgi:predicted NBD/HSP70 family sugar kinase